MFVEQTVFGDKHIKYEDKRHSTNLPQAIHGPVQKLSVLAAHRLGSDFIMIPIPGPYSRTALGM